MSLPGLMAPGGITLTFAHSLKYFETGSDNRIRPSFTRIMIADAVIGFVMEVMRKMVSVVMYFRRAEVILNGRSQYAEHFRSEPPERQRLQAAPDQPRAAGANPRRPELPVRSEELSVAYHQQKRKRRW